MVKEKNVKPVCPLTENDKYRQQFQIRTIANVFIICFQNFFQIIKVEDFRIKRESFEDITKVLFSIDRTRETGCRT